METATLRPNEPQRGGLAAAAIALALWLGAACVMLAGCGPTDRTADLIPNTPPAYVETPAANLPATMRPYNWTDSRGSGSCVHASTCYMLRWRGLEDFADWWRRNHAGGETDSSIRAYHDKAGLKYGYTRSADAAFLDWCSRTRRGAIIWFYTAHCVTFCGFVREADGREYAYINDNNRPSNFIRIERSEFLRRWRGYGGFALSILDPPVPPPLWPRWQVPANPQQ